MRKWIIGIIIFLPVIEIWGILQVGDWIGGWNTFMLLLCMSLFGAVATLLEGKKVWLEAQRQMNTGQIPGRSLVKGVCIILGGVLLLIPGFLSDIVGLILLLPFTRPIFEQFILTWIEKSMRNGKFTINRF